MESIDISEALDNVLKRVNDAKSRRPKHLENEVCLVAVSKTKPKEMILEAYSFGQRHFGENYVNELLEKGSDPELLGKCPDIKWHFIGHLQSNKINKLIAVPNLYIIQTVDSKKVADCLDKAWAKAEKTCSLKVMIQVNTSGEGSKSGVTDCEMNELTRHVIENCSHLTLAGFMTIGYANYDLEKGPNPEFESLLKYKDTACKMFNIESSDIGVSMGMSHDFEHAIEVGSTCIRVGSSIFGARVKSTPEA